MSVNTRRESSIENIPQVCLVITLRELERQGRAGSRLFKVREARAKRPTLKARACERANEFPFRADCFEIARCVAYYGALR